ncbi:Na+/H+ antiporter subunit E [Thiomicrorhabdus sediminis]|uniref:Na+/H+ antiporter subunit E n=1 Tax=Thiomicrorhabdus sediminis TaxID=2580412 RepID=A0A4P9K2W1_9GAMM|nr:Na+/H+ antiporter subunit E [Thiomicrorhabdus sediminis]QCU89158.1 Na+/H+ antiporter subunit E [Thiomicrorhabdus sediminis]
MNRFLPHPILSLVLWLVWLLLNNTLAAGHMILGAVLAIVIPLLTSKFWPESVCIRYPATLFKFVVIVLWDILIANVIVAKLILGNKHNLEPKFLHIPLDLENPLAIGILANTISLTPGTVSCDLSEDKKILLVHGLHESDPESTINEIKQRYEKPLKKVFETC